MKLCSECVTAAWPFAMVTVIAGVVGFITWLVLGLSDMEPLLRHGAALGVFAASEATLVHYVLACMRRHCRHGVQVNTGQRLNA